jgi:hypothetical protein
MRYYCSGSFQVVPIKGFPSNTIVQINENVRDFLWQKMLMPFPFHKGKFTIIGVKHNFIFQHAVKNTLWNPDFAVAIYCDLRILAATLASRFCSSAYV